MIISNDLELMCDLSHNYYASNLKEMPGALTNVNLKKDTTDASAKTSLKSYKARKCYNKNDFTLTFFIIQNSFKSVNSF